MTTLEYTITNNLMAGLALKEIESKIPCFYNVSDTNFENLEDLITVTVHCRKEDEDFVRVMLMDADTAKSTFESLLILS